MPALRRFIVATILFWCLAASWAWATPLGGSPDEPAHAIRAAAVASGQIITPAWEENPAYGAVVVPEAFAALAGRTCYAFDPEVTPDCFAGPPPGDGLVLTGTSAALNSPLYYAIVGWPSQIIGGDAAIGVMRLVSALVCAILFGLAVAALPRPRSGSPWPAVGTVAAVTPMTAFLAGSINPNAMEALSALALLLTGAAILKTAGAGGRPAGWQVMGAGLALVLLVNARSIGFLWAAVIIAALGLHAGRHAVARTLRMPVVRRAALVVALPIGLSLYWLAVLPDYDQSGTPTIGVSAPGAAARALLGSVELLTESVGLFGWLDTPAPAAAVLGHGAAFTALAVLMVAGSGRRAMILPAMLLGAAVTVPVVVQSVIADELGYIWQGRYTLAMVVCAAAALGLAAGTADLQLPSGRTRALVMAILAAVTLSHVASGLVVLRRYVTGTSAPWSDLITAPVWQPPLGWPTVLIALAVMAIAAAAVTARWCTTSGEEARAMSAGAPPPSPRSPEDLPTDRSNTRGPHDLHRERDIVSEP